MCRKCPNTANSCSTGSIRRPRPRTRHACSRDPGLSTTPIYLSEADVADLLDFEGALDVARVGISCVAQGKATNRPRQRIALGEAGYHQYVGWTAEDGVVGLKVYTVSKPSTPMHILLHLRRVWAPCDHEWRPGERTADRRGLRSVDPLPLA